MPNIIAYLVLFAWPLIARRIFQKTAVVDAAILLFLVPYLLLPVKTGVDLPLLPMIDKETIASIVALLLLRKPLSEAGQFKMAGIIKACFLAIFGGLLFTVLLNSDPLVFNAGVIPGLRMWDYIGFAFNQFFFYFVPFLVGYRLLSSAHAHERLVYWIALAGLVYLLPMLWEVRMSPQLHAQIYGFFPHSFAQQIRQGGFRPVVFLGHGLLVAFFAYSACVCAYAWMKSHDKLWRIPSKYALVALILGLILCKTLGVIFYLACSCLLLMFLPTKKRYTLMLILSLVVLFYPALREAVTPQLNWFANYIEELNPERAQSFQFRLDNEESLLERAQERSWFGWGGWGRNHIYDQSGQMISVTDGIWISVFGWGGWIGYLGFMGLLVMPFWLYWRRADVLSKSSESLFSSALLVLLLCNLIDFIPNSSLSHLTVLLAGGLVGRALRPD